MKLSDSEVNRLLTVVKQLTEPVVVKKKMTKADLVKMFQSGYRLKALKK